jgi:phage terminase large subunit-like protein
MNIPTLHDIKLERERRKYNFIESVFPETGDLRRDLYIKHMEFFKLGADHYERLFLAGNRVGKSFSGLFEDVCHLTGIYPDWWEGRRFDKPIKMWIATPTSEKTRDVVQRELIGHITDFGTGFIPKDLIQVTNSGMPGTLKMGVSKALDSVLIQHVSGGNSELKFKSYKEGVLSFESDKIDVVHLDEEPPLEIWASCLARTMTQNGICYLTETPLLGMTHLLTELIERNKNCAVIMATWDDAPHLTTEQKERLWESIPEYQREARSKGVPALGSGAIYPISDEDITVEDFPIPDHWPRIRGMDTGWNWTSACWIVYDPDTKTKYVYDSYKSNKTEMPVHAASINAKGKWIDGPCDYAGTDQSDGKKILQGYQDLGVSAYGANKSGKNIDLHNNYNEMLTAQLKVFKRGGAGFLEEKRLYRRDIKGNIVKESDHIMDAFQYANKVPVNEWKVETFEDSQSTFVSHKFTTRSF